MLSQIEKEIKEMLNTVLEMWTLVHQAFMEHNLDLFSSILDKENKLNEWEKKLLSQLVELNKNKTLNKKEEKKISVYMDIVADLELIGDYCKDILERVEIKIHERLLFSDEAVNEYNQLYSRSREALERVYRALEEEDIDLLNKVIREEEKIDRLAKELREHHNERLIKGICSPLAGNMFINILDFTALIYKNTVNVAKLLKNL
ncbi:MAG: hypothetical protein N2Z79_04730 [Candidatus Omnitrophica bacterium]|nr:hypothetical protein [Candidatus Omnitrophota bacterium]